MKIKYVLGVAFLFVFFCISGASLFAETSWLNQAEGYAQAKQQSVTQGKPMLLYFYADWCPYCRKFEKNILSTDEVKNALNGYVVVRINPEKGADVESLAGQYRVDGYPTVILESTGTKVKKRDISRFTQSAEDFSDALKIFEEKYRGVKTA